MKPISRTLMATAILGAGFSNLALAQRVYQPNTGDYGAPHVSSQPSNNVVHPNYGKAYQHSTGEYNRQEYYNPQPGYGSTEANSRKMYEPNTGDYLHSYGR